MREEILKLAKLLMLYERDEPHYGKSDSFYPEITDKDIIDWSSQEHNEDESQVCIRCLCEEAFFKACWILEHMEK
jgi:hypothetical protein